MSREALRSNRLSDLRVDVAEPFGVPDIYQLEELRQNIRRAVEELPEPYREAFEMNRFENRTYKEIAEELGISAKTVDYRIQQSLKILRVKLKDYLPLILFLQAAGMLGADHWFGL
ncbi:sigma-70 family RNA polymerase sigma factor [Alistipes sp.]|uniref:sigma-70 family RNA polymerase sigma factor n=1 Tax=Alistipes sp. TaxID=1872444 RepID=UPI0031FC60D8